MNEDMLRLIMQEQRQRLEEAALMSRLAREARAAGHIGRLHKTRHWVGVQMVRAGTWLQGCCTEALSSGSHPVGCASR
jgi:hypothetical protein